MRYLENKPMIATINGLVAVMIIFVGLVICCKTISGEPLIKELKKNEKGEYISGEEEEYWQKLSDEKNWDELLRILYPQLFNKELWEAQHADPLEGYRVTANEGTVIVKGEYIEPPYEIEERDWRIYINGRQVMDREPERKTFEQEREFHFSWSKKELEKNRYYILTQLILNKVSEIAYTEKVKRFHDLAERSGYANNKEEFGKLYDYREGHIQILPACVKYLRTCKAVKQAYMEKYSEGDRATGFTGDIFIEFYNSPSGTTIMHPYPGKAGRNKPTEKDEKIKFWYPNSELARVQRGIKIEKVTFSDGVKIIDYWISGAIDISRQTIIKAIQNKKLSFEEKKKAIEGIITTEELKKEFLGGE